MKKLSFFMLSLLAVTMLTSCGSDDEPVNKQTVNMAFNARLLDSNNESITFSQNNGVVELNYTDMTIKFSTSYKDQNGMTQTLTFPTMKLVHQNGTVYYCDATDGQIGRLMIDLGTGMMWYQASNPSDGTTLVLTTHLLYAYTTTTMNNPENGNHGSHNQSAYLFSLDSRGETCVMRVSNFMTNMNGVVDAPEIQYDGLIVTPTATGYKITAEEAESNYKGFYKLTDVEFNIIEQCQVFTGSFKCNGLEYTISGNLFSGN